MLLNKSLLVFEVLAFIHQLDKRRHPQHMEQQYVMHAFLKFVVFVNAHKLFWWQNIGFTFGICLNLILLKNFIDLSLVLLLQFLSFLFVFGIHHLLFLNMQEICKFIVVFGLIFIEIVKSFFKKFLNCFYALDLVGVESGSFNFDEVGQLC